MLGSEMHRIPNQRRHFRHRNSAKSNINLATRRSTGAKRRVGQ